MWRIVGGQVARRSCAMVACRTQGTAAAAYGKGRRSAAVFAAGGTLRRRPPMRYGSTIVYVAGVLIELGSPMG